MGRIAGVTAAETRERLLLAAADVFAERGYDGTRVADIAAAAGVSNGAMYAHFPSKAELLAGALRTHGLRLLAEVFAADPDRSITDLLLVIGRWLPRRRDVSGYLIVEALVAARRDEDVARPMRDYVGERGDWLAALMRAAQASDELDPGAVPGGARALLPPAGHGQRARHAGPARGRRRSLGRVADPHRDGSRTTGTTSTDRDSVMRVQIDSERCQGHGRCYDLAPRLFGDDDEGYGQVLGDGVVPPGQEREAHLAAANCPEHAIDVLEEA